MKIELNSYQLKNATLRQLKNIRSMMLNIDYLIELEKSEIEERKKAALLLSKVQLAYLKLRTIKLADIRANLEQNNKELSKSITSLEDALKVSTKIVNIINSVSNFLSIVTKIIPISLK